jgi:hypothetical protein
MRKCAIVITILIMVLLTACASIVSNKNYPVTLNSTPDNAQVTVKDSSGNIIFSGKTPTTITLDASSGYFQTAQYEIELAKSGCGRRTIELNGKLDKWYFGNLLVGGLFGLLVVDPSTGCMWKLDQKLHANLLKKTSFHPVNTFRVVTLNNLSAELKRQLTPIQ